MAPVIPVETKPNLNAEPAHIIETSSPERRPRIIHYHQTHFYDGNFISLLPLLTTKTAITHIIVGAIHLHGDDPSHININDDPYTDPKLQPLWAELKVLRSSGVRILGMLGGAAKGSFALLDSNSREDFVKFYGPLREMIKYCDFQGLDLDVEEKMSLPGVIRLITSLKMDFGPAFTISLAPVAPALMHERCPFQLKDASTWQVLPYDPQAHHLSGFSYFELEKAVGPMIAWYNTQFYCGWGSLDTIEDFVRIIEGGGFGAERVAVGCSTNPKWGNGYVGGDMLSETLTTVLDIWPNLAGVMGWEFHHSMTDGETGGDRDERWECWAGMVTEVVLKERSLYIKG